MTAYYNEHDAKAAAWLRELIRRGVIAPGDVDERDIRDIKPAELAGYTQCHFFAGIGVWSYALRSAGWSDDRPVWTGSCPCQPFSAAGRRGGTSDERHLWPHWNHLIRECAPAVIFGEQVASKDGLGWFDLVHSDLEGSGYAVGVADLCAAGVGAPHIRQRLYFVAEQLADAEGLGRAGRAHDEDSRRRECASGRAGSAVVVGHADDERLEGRQLSTECAGERLVGSTGVAGRERPGPVNGVWRDADWLFCRDGKWQPVETRTFPLAYGSPARVGRLRGYGNAIVAPLAQTFIEAYLDTLEERRSVRLMSEMTDYIGGLFA